METETRNHVVEMGDTLRPSFLLSLQANDEVCIAEWTPPSDVIPQGVWLTRDQAFSAATALHRGYCARVVRRPNGL